MKLFQFDASPNCMRTRSVINELGLEVELVNIDIKNKPADFLAASPGGKVPAFVDDDGFTLFESRAIDVFLTSKRPERDLYPTDPKRRALVDQWTFWQAIHLGPAMQTVAFERVVKQLFGMGETDESVVSAKLAEAEKLLPVLDGALAGKEWLVDKLTLADYTVASTFYLRKPAGISLAKVPNVERWIARVEQQPAWRAALPKFLAKLDTV
jgi:glutathione S-transferase